MLWFIYTTIKGNKLELIKEKSTFIYDGKGISKEELNLIVKHDYFLTVMVIIVMCVGMLMK